MRVLVCDDHPIVALAIATKIETAFVAEVIISHSYMQALHIAAEFPDIALCLLDIRIPGEDGHHGVMAIKSALPQARIVLFSGSEDVSDMMLALSLDTHGFLPKSSTPEVVEAALRLVLAGGIYLPSGIGQLAMHQSAMAIPFPDHALPPSSEIRQGAASPHYGKLTERQRLVLQHVATGKSNKEIARDLDISPATVKAHVAQIIAVLGASNRTEASARARELGLIDAA